MKILKYFTIALTLLVAIVAIGVSVTLYLVFTPSRLTPIVESQLKEQMGLEVSIKSADLTLFSSFPEFQVQVDSLVCNSIGTISRVAAAIDVEELIDGNIIINKLYLDGAKVDVSMQRLAEMGLISSSPTVEEETSLPLNQLIQLSEVEMSDLELLYRDDSTQISAHLEIPTLSLEGEIDKDSLDVKIVGGASVKSLMVADTIALNNFVINELNLDVQGSLEKNIFNIYAKSALQIGGVVFNGEELVSGATIAFELPALIDVDGESATLQNSSLALNDLQFSFSGDVKNQEGGNPLADLNIKSNRLKFSSIIALVPSSYLEPYRKEINQILRCGGAVEADIHGFVDLSGAKKSTISIASSQFELGNNRLSVKGVVADALGDVDCNLKIRALADIAQLMAFVPDSVASDIAAQGILDGSFEAKFKVEDLVPEKIEQICAKGNIAYNKLKLNYCNEIDFADRRGKFNFTLDSKQPQLLSLNFEGDNIDFFQKGVGKASLLKPKFCALLSNPLDTTKILDGKFDYQVADLLFDSDSIKAHIIGADGELTLHPDSLRKSVPVMMVKYRSDSLSLDMTDVMVANTGNISVIARSSHDATQKRMLLKWNPLLNVDFNNGEVKLANIEPIIHIPAIKFDYRLEDMVIHDSRVVIQDSDFALRGNIGNIRSCLESPDTKLVGELNYHSKHTDLDQLMALSEQFSSPESESEASEAQNSLDSTQLSEPHPFMVPKRLNIALNTQVESALFDGKEITDIRGSVVVNNGELIMDQVGFRSEAAKMYLTAIYRPERTNHIYAGLNFHLVDIDIDKLVDIVPSVDTLMPMLKDFEGKAEFHLAAETYLTSSYGLKMSTLRGAMAIKGQDLVLLDGETFSQASKLLMFSKKARNVIDSMSVEATLFRDEIDIYPFLISMDRWQAVLSGRHNTDMNFNYHVSVVDCPLPVRLGVDIKGNLDDMKIKLAPCKYKALYKPKKQGATEKQILNFKNIVSNSLIKNLESRKDYKGGL